ncbi:hypothetical protein ACIPUO_03960 [Pectobacterium carotovorum]|uniref:hypothetical protein n=1 Tax=Pectobacterium carotovorum TaxID=554 RepID=UPI00380128A0
MRTNVKYIYFDTNTINDFKEFSEDDWLAFQNANKLYKFPYSAAHILDLMNSSPEYLNEDFLIINELSKNNFLDMSKDGSITIRRLDIPISSVFDKIVKDYNESGEKALKDRKYFLPGFDRYKIDVDMMHKKSFLYQMAEKTKGIFDGNFSNFILNHALDNIDSHSTYNQMRKQAQDAIAHTKEYKTYNSIPEEGKIFLQMFASESFDSDLFETLNSYMSLSYKIQGKDWTALSTPHKIIDVYTLLDIVKGFSEKIGKNNRWTNMLHDAEHCANASMAKYFISNEKNNYAKVNFIRENFNLSFKVITAADFINKFRM